MATVIAYYDLETTGLHIDKHGIHQLAMIIERDGEVVEELDLRMDPGDVIIDPSALLTSSITEMDIRLQEPHTQVFRRFQATLSKYCDKYDRRDKIWLCGYNNRGFDDPFLRRWFERNGDMYYGSWFWADSLDVLVLASQHLIPVRRSMLNFKLSTVASAVLGEAAVAQDKLHDALYDVRLTRAIYKEVTRC